MPLTAGPSAVAAGLPSFNPYAGNLQALPQGARSREEKMIADVQVGTRDFGGLAATGERPTFQLVANPKQTRTAEVWTSTLLGVAVHSEEHSSYGYSDVMDMVDVKLTPADALPGSQGVPAWNSPLSRSYCALLYKVANLEKQRLTHPAKAHAAESEETKTQNKVELSPEEWQMLVAAAVKLYGETQIAGRRMDASMGVAKAAAPGITPSPARASAKELTDRHFRQLSMQRDLDAQAQQDILELETGG